MQAGSRFGLITFFVLATILRESATAVRSAAARRLKGLSVLFPSLQRCAELHQHALRSNEHFEGCTLRNFLGGRRRRRAV